MQNTNNNSHDFLLAIAIGGVLGAACASIYFASKNREEGRPLNSVGRVMVKIGEVLDAPQFSDTRVAKDVEKKMDKYEDTVVDVINMITAGMKLWEQVKKGA